MEKSSYNPEHEAQLENIEFYKKWIKDTFDMESVHADELYSFYDKLKVLKLTETSPRFLHHYGIDMTSFSAERDKLATTVSRQLQEQLVDTAIDLQQNIFEAELFEVYVISMKGERKKVEGVIVHDHHIVPIIEGERYDIRNIDGIAF